MAFTGFFPVFVILALIALRSPSGWILACAIGCFFQAASPIIVGGGGRLAGIGPAYALLPIGFIHCVFLFRQSQAGKLPSYRVGVPLLCLTVFTVVGVLGGYALPRYFQGLVSILPPRDGLDSALTEALKPVGTNTIQSLFLALNLVLVWMVSYFAQLGQVTSTSIVRAIVIGAAISCLLGVYQLIAAYTGLPWPSGILNSNWGQAQGFHQTALGLKRISSTFLEPGLLAAHLLPALAIALVAMAPLWIAALFTLVLLGSLSSTAYVGFAVLALLLPTAARGEHRARMIAGVVIFLLLVTAGLVVDHVYTNGAFLNGLVLDKMESTSGISRARANELALQAWLDTYGLGVGIGSTRASSMVVQVLATTGIAGGLALLGLMLSVLAPSMRSRIPANRAIGYGLATMMIGNALSMPDLSLPLMWLLVGSIAGLCSVRPEEGPRRVLAL